MGNAKDEQTNMQSGNEGERDQEPYAHTALLLKDAVAEDAQPRLHLKDDATRPLEGQSPNVVRPFTKPASPDAGQGAGTMTGSGDSD
jgi:hypothetical protein